MLDGIETQCDLVMNLLNGGAGVIAPLQTTRYNYNNSQFEFFRAYANGTQGWAGMNYVPGGATGGGLDIYAEGTRIDGIPAGPDGFEPVEGGFNWWQGGGTPIGWFAGPITDDMFNYVAKYYVEPFYDPCAKAYSGNPLPGKEQATLALAAATLDSDFAAKISGIWAKESYLALTPDGDAGPAQLTTWWKRNHPELVVGNSYGSWNGRTTKPFDGSVRDNIATLRNIVYFSHNRYQGSYYQTAYWYGPGDPKNPVNAPNERKKYAGEVINYYNTLKPFFDCLGIMGRP